MKINGMQDSTCFLINFYGTQRHYKDTAKFNSTGTIIFDGDEALPGGLYSVFCSGKILFNFIINESYIELETDTSNYIKNMKIKKSDENKLFFEQMLFINEKEESIIKIRKKLADKETPEKEKNEIQNQLKAIGKEIKDYRLNLIKENANTFLAVFYRTMKEPEVPDFIEEKNDSLIRLLKYEYLKNHFWDDVDFSDERINNTPLYHSKLEKYFQSIVFPVLDSINKEVDYVINKSKANEALFKYTVLYLINKYERSKIMGMDGVFVHIALNYYTHDLVFWVDSTQVERVQEKARKLAPLLIGKQAINLSLIDTSGTNWINMYRDLKTDYTILVFWDPGCGHCKKEIPKLAEYYKTLKGKSVSVYSVCPLADEEWRKFVREHNLDFYNVAVPTVLYGDQKKASEKAREYIISRLTDTKSLDYKNTYDVFTYPQIYLLDKNKKIIGKKLDTGLVKQILDREFSIKK